MSLEAKLYKSYTVLEDKKANSLYSQSWFGIITRSGNLKLDPYETVLLVERGRIIVLNNSGEILPLMDIVGHFSKEIPQFLVNYLLYKDLRSRGYVVKQHKNESNYFVLYNRGAKPNNGRQIALVVPMIEGSLFDIDAIDKIVSRAKKVAEQLLFAVIDSLGDVSYYSVKELEFKKNIIKVNEMIVREDKDEILP